MGKDTSKQVKYRRRHKVLNHVPEKDTNHNFEGRMPMEVPQGGASGPVFCSVLDYQADRTNSIVMNNENYSNASKQFDNWPTQDQPGPLDNGRRRSRRSTSSRSGVGDPEVSTSSPRREPSSRTSTRKDSCGNDWGLTTEPNLGDSSSIWRNSTVYLPHQLVAQQQITHLRLEGEATHMHAPQAQNAAAGEQLPWLTVIEDKKDHHTAYGYPVNFLPNAQPTQMFSLYSHESWPSSLPFDFSSPNSPMVSSGGQPILFDNYPSAQLSSQDMPQANHYPIWPLPAPQPSPSVDYSSYGEYTFRTVHEP